MCKQSRWKSYRDNAFRAKFFKNNQQLCKKLSGTPVTESSLYFALLRQWLKECDKSHVCKPKAQFWPTRVIFVGDSDSTLLELWETESKKDKLSDLDGYIALSHRWGNPNEEDKKQFCTTRDNYQRRKEGFSMDDLPKTFKDAVQVTRVLGKQCLWVDALCIIQAIQDEEDSDWKDEARLMEQVFGSAYCTIAASSSMNWREGFVEQKSTPRFIQDVSEGWIYACDDIADYTEVDTACLNRRAWVLQERVLSRRIIHFTKGYIYWECGDGVRCENFTKLQTPKGKEHFLLDPEFPKRLKRSGYLRTTDFIQFLFEKYAQSDLTKKSDRYIAISSLMKRMESVLETECRYGVFKSFLSRLLLWRRPDRTYGNETQYKDQHLPSWSWMTYSHIHFEPVKRPLKFPAAANLRFDTERKVLLVQVREFQNCRMERKEGQYVILDAHSKDVGVLWFDTTTTVHFKHCVVIAMDLDYYILLVREIGLENQFERVGLGKIKVRAHCISKEYCEGKLS